MMLLEPLPACLVPTVAEAVLDQVLGVVSFSMRSANLTRSVMMYFPLDCANYSQNHKITKLEGIF